MGSIKKTMQKLIPDGLLHYYKKVSAHRILKRFDAQSQPELKICRDILSSLNGTFVDVGANIGLYTFYLAERASNVISVEPIPWTYEILTYNINKFGLKNVEAVNVGLSNAAGKANFTVPETKEGIQNYYRARIAPDHKDGIKVKVLTLDHLIREREREVKDIALIKIDVEGHYLECVQGAMETIEKHRPALLIEVDEDPDKEGSNAKRLSSKLTEKGYRDFVLHEGYLKPREKGVQAINYFFLTDRHKDILLNHH